MSQIVPYAVLPIDVVLLVERLTSPDAETRRYALMERPVPEDRLAAVRAALAAHEAASKIPLGREALTRWLATLAMAVANRPDEAALEGRLAGIVLACGEIPAAVLTEELLAESLRRFKFFPAVAELVSLIEEHAARWRAQGGALRHILAKAAKAAEPVAENRLKRAPTAEELAELDATLEAFQENATAWWDKAIINRRPFTHEQLVAAYEPLAARGDRAAITRLAMLAKDHG